MENENIIANYSQYLEVTTAENEISLTGEMTIDDDSISLKGENIWVETTDNIIYNLFIEDTPTPTPTPSETPTPTPEVNYRYKVTFTKNCSGVYINSYNQNGQYYTGNSIYSYNNPIKFDVQNTNNFSIEALYLQNCKINDSYYSSVISSKTTVPFTVLCTDTTPTFIESDNCFEYNCSFDIYYIPGMTETTTSAPTPTPTPTSKPTKYLGTFTNYVDGFRCSGQYLYSFNGVRGYIESPSDNVDLEYSCDSDIMITNLNGCTTYVSNGKIHINCTRTNIREDYDYIWYEYSFDIVQTSEYLEVTTAENEISLTGEMTIDDDSISFNATNASIETLSNNTYRLIFTSSPSTPTPSETPTPTPSETPTPTPEIYYKENVGFCFNVISETGNFLNYTGDENGILCIETPDLSEDKKTVEMITYYINEIPVYRTLPVNTDITLDKKIKILSNSIEFQVSFNDYNSGKVNNYAIPLNYLTKNKINEIKIKVFDKDLNNNDITITPFINDKLIYNVAAKDADIFVLSHLSKSTIGVISDENESHFSYMVINRKKVGISYTEYKNDLNTLSETLSETLNDSIDSINDYISKSYEYLYKKIDTSYSKLYTYFENKIKNIDVSNQLKNYTTREEVNYKTQLVRNEMEIRLNEKLTNYVLVDDLNKKNEWGTFTTNDITKVDVDDQYNIYNGYYIKQNLLWR